MLNIRNNPAKDENEYTKRPYNDIKLFCGLVSDWGIEEIISSKEFTAKKYTSLSLRTRFNSQRNMRIFTCAIKSEFVPDFNIHEPIPLYILLKKISIDFVED